MGARLSSRVTPAPPIPSTAHMCEARSGWEKASTGPGPDWSVAYTLGPLSDTPRLQPSTVRCIGVLFVCGSAALSKQQLVFYTGFAVTSNDSNRHICITSQHLQLNSRPPRLCDRPGRASPPKVVSPPRIVKLRTRLQRRGAGLWGGWQQHSRRYSFAVEQGLVVMTQGGSRSAFYLDGDRQTRPRTNNCDLGSIIMSDLNCD